MSAATLSSPTASPVVGAACQCNVLDASPLSILRSMAAAPPALMVVNLARRVEAVLVALMALT